MIRPSAGSMRTAAFAWTKSSPGTALAPSGVDEDAASAGEDGADRRSSADRKTSSRAFKEMLLLLGILAGSIACRLGLQRGRLSCREGRSGCQERAEPKGSHCYTRPAGQAPRVTLEGGESQLGHQERLDASEPEAAPRPLSLRGRPDQHLGLPGRLLRHRAGFRLDSLRRLQLPADGVPAGKRGPRFVSAGVAERRGRRSASGRTSLRNPRPCLLYTSPS